MPGVGDFNHCASEPTVMQDATATSDAIHPFDKTTPFVSSSQMGPG